MLGPAANQPQAIRAENNRRSKRPEHSRTRQQAYGEGIAAKRNPREGRGNPPGGTLMLRLGVAFSRRGSVESESPGVVTALPRPLSCP